MNRKIVLVCLFVIFIAAMAVYWLKLGYTMIPLREGLYLSTPLIATIAGILALRSYGFSGPRTLTLVLLTAGVGYWLVGDLLFDYYQYILRTTPFPSAADIFYTLAYPLLFFGFLNEVRASKVNWRKINPATIFLFAFAALCLAAIVIYFGMIQAYKPTETLFTNIIAMGYGGGDLLLIIGDMLVLILAWEFRGGNLSRVWLILFLSFIFTLIGDILFAIYNEQYEMWIYKSIIDSCYMISYLTYAYGLFELRFSIVDAYSRILNLKKEHKKEIVEKS